MPRPQLLLEENEYFGKGKHIVTLEWNLMARSKNVVVSHVEHIRWSNDMYSTWNNLIQSPNYHLSMDLFKMGILVKKQSKHKEHFVIKMKNILKSM